MSCKLLYLEVIVQLMGTCIASQAGCLVKGKHNARSLKHNENIVSETCLVKIACKFPSVSNPSTYRLGSHRCRPQSGLFLREGQWQQFEQIREMTADLVVS